MLSQNNNIDKAFKNALLNTEEVPSPAVWEGIEAHLGKDDQKRRVFIVWGMIAAASLFAAVMGTIFFMQPQSVNNATAFIANSTDTKEETAKQIEESLWGSDRNDEYANLNVDNKSNSDIPKQEAIAMLSEEKPSYKNNSEFVVNEDNDVKDEFYFSKLEGKAIGQLEVSVDIDTRTPKVKTVKEYQPLYATNVTEVQDNRIRLVVGGAVSPVYSNGESSSSGSNAFASNSSTESGVSSLGGGINLRIESRSKWSFETGVVYAQVGQEKSNNSDFVAHAVSADGVYATGFSESEKYLTSMGSVRVSSSKNLADEANFGAVSLKSTMVNADAIRQTLDYIEIPMLARYRLVDGFPMISLSGGLSSNFLVDNNAYLFNGNTRTEVGKTNNIKSFVMSSSFGVGVEVPITKMIRINVEPRFKYFLDSVNSDPSFDYKPYSFSVFGGLVFLLH